VPRLKRAPLTSIGAFPDVVVHGAVSWSKPDMRRRTENMKRLILPAGVLLAAATPAGAGAAVAVGVAGSTPAPTAAHARAYERVYAKVARALGRRAPGRNIVKDGVSKGHPASDAQVVASLGVLERMLAGALAPAGVPTSTLATSTTVSSGGAGGVPACASESGTNYSTGPSNTNASSGATGRYQITPGTAAAYGCDLATAAGQDACAQTIYAHQGASAWMGCGG
jgi:hypothetical protein